MTPEEYDKLTADERRAAVAKLCGWDEEEIERGYTLSQYPEYVPDYLHDLNACHEFEAQLTGDGIAEGHNEVSRYFQWLKVICQSPAPYNATAEQRCKALVLTKASEMEWCLKHIQSKTTLL